MKTSARFLRYLILSITAMFMMSGIFAGNASAVTEVYGDFLYFYDRAFGDKAIILEYTGTDTEVVIPSFVDNHPVTAIGDSAFKDCTKIESITVPGSVESIGASAFMNCCSLKSINIPNGVAEVADETFQGCSVLESITIPDSVASIGENAFYYCIGLKTVTFSNNLKSIGSFAFYTCYGLESLTIPKSVASISDNAFNGCYNLKSLTISEGVSAIGDSAFANCDGLTSITLPDSVASVGKEAFAGCSLTSIAIPEKVIYIGPGAFKGGLSEYKVSASNEKYCSKDGVLFDKAMKTLAAYPAGKNGLTYSVPDSVTSIEASAFYGCSLTSIIIPDSVASVGRDAFDFCWDLKDVYYSGSASDWEKIEINEYGNDYLVNAEIHYNSNGTAPSAPTFGDTVMGSGGMYVYWNSVPGATSYRLYRADTPTGKKTQLAVTGSLYYLDSTVTPGKTYYYFLRAYNNKTSELSNYTSARRAAATVLTAPGLTDSAIGTAGLYLYWNKIPAATSYRVYRADTQTGAKKLLTTTASTSFVDGTAVSGKTYYYFVAAFNGSTNIRSAFSTARKITMTKISTPSLTDTCIGDAGLYLYWSSVPGATSYRIYRADSQTGEKKQILVTASLNGIDKTAEAGKTYYYYVAAFNNKTNIRSAYSSSRKVTMTKISAPVISSAVKTTSGVKLTWNTVAGATSYRVYRADTLTGAKTQLTVQAGTTFTDTTAVKGKTYYYFVAAFNNKTNIRSAMSKNKSCTA